MSIGRNATRPSGVRGQVTRSITIVTDWLLPGWAGTWMPAKVARMVPPVPRLIVASPQSVAPGVHSACFSIRNLIGFVLPFRKTYASGV